MNGEVTVRDLVKTSIGYMTTTSILGIALGLIMLFYPGGTMVLMETAFVMLQILVTIFIVFYAMTETMYYYKAGHKAAAVLYGVAGAIAAILIWVLNVSVIYYTIAFFLILSGVADIVGAIRIKMARYFLILLGGINIILGIIIAKNPVILPLLIAWYILFWGISRLFLALELKKALK